MYARKVRCAVYSFFLHVQNYSFPPTEFLFTRRVVISDKLLTPRNRGRHTRSRVETTRARVCFITDMPKRITTSFCFFSFFVMFVFREACLFVFCFLFWIGVLHYMHGSSPELFFVLEQPPPRPRPGSQAPSCPRGFTWATDHPASRSPSFLTCKMGVIAGGRCGD